MFLPGFEPTKKERELESKLRYTRELIRCWVDSWGVDGVRVNISGGKDSTVLLHIVRLMFPDIKGVFVNTGLEFPEIVRFVKTLDNVDIVRPKYSFKQVIEKYGWPVISKVISTSIDRYRNTKIEDQRWYRLFGKYPYGGYMRTSTGKKKVAGVIPKKWLFMTKSPFKISGECCVFLKKNPMKKYAKLTGTKPFIGIMANDSNQRNMDIIKRGCNIYDAKEPMSRPLARWNDNDIWEYIKKYDVEYCDIYDKGYGRTGCIFCMYGLQQEIKHTGSNRFSKLKETHPVQYNYIINKLGAGEVLDFMGIEY